MSRLEISLLGPPLVRLDGRQVALDTRKAVALLSYLAVTQTDQRRDTLSALLWPEISQSRSRSILRQTIYSIRKSIPGDWLSILGDSIGIIAGADVRVDTHEFHDFIETCTRHGHPGSGICGRCGGPLTKAAELYRDDFLTGFTVRDSVNFDDWQMQQTEVYRRELISVLEKLVRCYGHQGKYEQAAGYARRWLSIDPLYETAHCWLMQLYYWAGLRAAALRQYQECMRILRRELDTAPAESTTRLFNDIKEGRLKGALAVRSLLQEPFHKPGDVRQERFRTPVSTFDDYRLVTVLSVGCEGLRRSGDQGFRAIQIISRVLEKYGGRIDRSDGDSALVVFGWSRTHESDPELAVRTALEIHEEIGRAGGKATIGVNTGGVYFSAEGKDRSRDSALHGSVVNLAVRLHENAQTGHILAGEPTYRLTRQAFSYVPVRLKLSGRKEPLNAHRVSGLLTQPRKTRGIEGLRADLVGRDDELRDLRNALSAAMKGQGQIAFIIGEAGVGKSRLSLELKNAGERDFASVSQRAGTDPPLLWLEGRCLELESATSYWPFQDMLQGYFQLHLEDEPEERAKRITSRLMEVPKFLSMQRVKEIGSVIHRMLSAVGLPSDAAEWRDMHPERIRNQTFLAIRDFFLALCRSRPLVLVFEDLHWADHLSLDLISLLMESVSQYPLFLLCVFRPESGHRCMHLPTIASRKAPGRLCEVHLRELASKNSEKLMASLLREESLPAQFKEMLLGRTQGNPFYVEEIVRSLIDSGTLYREGQQWLLRKQVSAVAAPESLQSVILSRIGLLREEVKAVLRVASVIGSVFRKPLLRRTVPESVDLEKVLEELEDRELIYEGRVIPEEEYSFRHVLLQETVYSTLTEQDRIQIHARIANSMETLYPENLDEFAELLAHHFDKAKNTEKAIHYLYQAGEKARRAYANREAVAHFQRGLELVRRVAESEERDRRELKLIIALGVPLIFTIGNAASEAGNLYQRGYELCKDIGNLDQLYHVQNGLRRFFQARGEISRSHELGLQMLELAKTLDNRVYLARGHMVLTETLLMEGSFSECCQHAKAGLLYCHDQMDNSNIDLFGVDTLSALINYEGVALTYMGFPNQGLALVDEAVQNAEKMGDPINLAVQSFFAAMAYFLMRDEGKTAEMAGTTLQYSSERESELFSAFGSILLGWADACLVGSDRGIEKIKEGIEAAEQTGSRFGHALFLFAYADALSKAGRLAEAHSVTADSLSLMKKTGELWWKSGTLRLLGESIVGMGGDASKAEECLQESLATAQSQGAKIFEIQATTALCRLWQRCGRAQQGFALLRETYQRFSEGFEFPCLKEAKEMLEAE